MADHYHYISEVQGAADERHDHREFRDLDYDIRQRAELHHRHHDDEDAIQQLRSDVRDLHADLEDAHKRIATLQQVLSAHLTSCGQPVSAAAVAP